MDNPIADLFNVDVMLKPVWWIIEFCGDGVTGQIIEPQVDDRVEGMDGNAGGPLGWQKVDCLVVLLNSVIMFVIARWDVVWVWLLVFGYGWLKSGHCRPK